METVAITSQAPVMPTAWPQSEHIRPVKRRLPNTVDEPKNIGYYLESLRVNPEKPDVPLNKNDAFQKVQKRRVQEKR